MVIFMVIVCFLFWLLGRCKVVIVVAMVVARVIEKGGNGR